METHNLHGVPLCLVGMLSMIKIPTLVAFTGYASIKDFIYTSYEKQTFVLCLTAIICYLSSYYLEGELKLEQYS